MKLLVTGVTGFVGTHLVQFLLAERADVEIFGLVRRGVERVSLPAPVRKLEAEIEHPASVDAVFDQVTPDAVVHLAFIVREIRDKKRIYDINVGGTDRVLDAASRLHDRRREHQRRARRGIVDERALILA